MWSENTITEPLRLVVTIQFFLCFLRYAPLHVTSVPPIDPCADIEFYIICLWYFSPPPCDSPSRVSGSTKNNFLLHATSHTHTYPPNTCTYPQSKIGLIELVTPSRLTGNVEVTAMLYEADAGGLYPKLVMFTNSNHFQPLEQVFFLLVSI